MSGFRSNTVKQESGTKVLKEKLEFKILTELQPKSLKTAQELKFKRKLFMK
jgi:hypothetical protein